MIREITIKNVLSFKDQTTIRFDTKEQGSISCFYGANGTGKSNFTTIIYFVRNLLSRDLSKISPDDTIFPTNFLLCDDPENESFIQVIFKIGESDYKYSVVFTSNSLLEEELKVNSKVVLNSALYSDIGKLNKSEVERLSTYNSKTVSLFSLLTNKKVVIKDKNIGNEISLFGDVIKSLSFYDTNELDYQQILMNDIAIKSKVIDFLQSINVPITDFDIVEESKAELLKTSIDSEKDSVPPFLNDMYNYFVEKFGNEKEYRIVNDKYVSKYNLKHTFLSSGLKRLIRLLVFVYSQSNGIMIIDEFDKHFHEKLSAKLISHFRKSNTQFIITSHLVDLFDSAYFSKKELFVLYQDEKLISRVYRLDKYALRNDSRNSYKNKYRNNLILGYPKYDIED